MICPGESFYRRPTETVARDLVGKKLVRIAKRNGKASRLAGIIVETEAYGYSNDPASHAHGGMTGRNSVMFGDVGRAYVYFTYGNHFCVNVSAKPRNIEAGAVLIRGIEAVEGIEIMKEFRHVSNVLALTSGPGKLTQALDITFSLNDVDMTDRNSDLRIEYGIKPKQVVATPRIGITRAVGKNWRFVEPDSPFVSRKVQRIKTVS